ncbi:alpha/beta hydrolase family protein [Pedobacter sp. PWIIR3]
MKTAMRVDSISYSLLFCLQLACQICFSQAKINRPVLSKQAIDSWQSVQDPAISSDGKFAGYVSVENYMHNPRVHLKSLSTNWELTINGAADFKLAAKSQNAVCIDSNNNLYILKLGHQVDKVISNVKSYHIINFRNKEFLIVHDYLNSLSFINLVNGDIKSYENIISYHLGQSSDLMAVISKKNNTKSVATINPDNFRFSELGIYKNVEDVVLDDDGEQVAFIAESGGTSSDGKILSIHSVNGYELVHTSTKQFQSLSHGKTLVGIEKFSRDGKMLFIKVLNNNPRIKNIPVQIWSYQDIRLRSQITPTEGISSAAYILNSNSIRELSHGTEEIEFLFKMDSMVCISNRLGDYSERNWNKYSVSRHYIYNIINGQKTNLGFEAISASPDGKYIIGKDSVFTNLLGYKIANNKTTNLTERLKFTHHQYNIAYNDRELFLFAGWIGEHTAFFYDNFDIWKLDLEFPEKLINVTGGKGRINNITFRFVNKPKNLKFSYESWKLLTGFDNCNKQNGFFSITSDYGKAPKKLSMWDCFYNSAQNNLIFGMYPIKAQNKNAWIVRKERTDESPNYYFTTDFKTFKGISKVFPERCYNWLTAELLQFQSVDQKKFKAILYKPTNFDSTKKYPVIIQFYQKQTDKLHHFIRPELSFDAINIPWFVSHGYLVCTPDIEYEKGSPGPSALKVVEGLARSFSKMPFVLADKLGLDGHSFGGYETNFIITQSKLFAAAHSSSGFSDLVSSVNSITLRNGNNYFREWAEIVQGRLEKTLWNGQDLYIKNSPIFFADNVCTPLLMMNNQKDGIVNFSQGVEFFTALRRLNKKVWMLQYDNGHHSLTDKADILDYSERLQGFFDHFLKGEPMPDWMRQHN